MISRKCRMIIFVTSVRLAVTLKQRWCCSESQLETMVFHARSAAQRREQRRRAEARFAGRLCELVEQRHRGFVPARALVRAAAGCPQDASTQTQRDDLVDAETQTQEYFQQRNVEQIVIPPPQQLGIPQDRISERIMEQTVDQGIKAVARTRRTAKRVAPTLAVTYAELDPAIEYVTAAPTGSGAAPAPVIEYVSSSPAAADAAPTAVSEYVAPAPTGTWAGSAPVIEHVPSSPADAYAAPTLVTDTVPPSVIKYEISSTTAAHAAPIPVIDTVRKQAKCAAAEAVKAHFDALRSGTGAAAEEEAAQASLAAARAEVETAQLEMLDAETALADLAAEALLREDDLEKAKKKAKHKHKKR